MNSVNRYFLLGPCVGILCLDCTEGLSCLLMSGLLLCPLLLTHSVHIVTHAPCPSQPPIFSLPAIPNN